MHCLILIFGKSHFKPTSIHLLFFTFLLCVINTIWNFLLILSFFFTWFCSCNIYHFFHSSSFSTAIFYVQPFSYLFISFSYICFRYLTHIPFFLRNLYNQFPTNVFYLKFHPFLFSLYFFRLPTDLFISLSLFFPPFDLHHLLQNLLSLLLMITVKFITGPHDLRAKTTNMAAVSRVEPTPPPLLVYTRPLMLRSMTRDHSLTLPTEPVLTSPKPSDTLRHANSQLSDVSDPAPHGRYRYGTA